MSNVSSLKSAALLFPIALVLYEFSVYVANDMIQPGMVLVVKEYAVGNEWVSRSMTAFLLGGVFLTWLLGPLSDHIGRRPVMLAGVAGFVLSCLAILWAWNIESFMVFRAIQGMGLCFIAAVGYAAVQESFDEKTAVKVMALMANVALIAPLLGPIFGAILIAYWPWQMTFVLIAAVAFVALVGLWKFMPETVERSNTPLKLGHVLKDYVSLLKDKAYMQVLFCVSILSVPLIVWIGLSPLILIEHEGFTPFEYGLAQIPVIGGLVLGNIILILITDKIDLGKSVLIGRLLIALGVAVFATAFALGLPLYMALIIGVGLMAIAEGLSFAVLYRFALTSTSHSIGIASAGLGMMVLLVFGVLLETASLIYEHIGERALLIMLMATGLMYVFAVPIVVRKAMQQRQTL